MLRGPERSSISTALEHLTSLTDVGLIRGTYWAPSCSGTGYLSTERRAKLNAIGFLSMLHILKIGTAPRPVHPLLIWLCLDGEKGVGVDYDFLRRVDGSLSRTLDALSAWDGSLASLSTGAQHSKLGYTFISASIDVSFALIKSFHSY